jgi:branched-chain amino acid aminotransferase
MYLRPFMFASEAFLGVRPANEYKFMVIASPVGAYFSGGVKPVKIWLSSNYARAAFGGTGAAKCGGNYAAGLLAQMEASERGCEQVCFVDATEHKWIEELGGMNLYFVFKDGTLVTPPTKGTILEGITRGSLSWRASRLKPVERAISVDEWRSGVSSGAITEVFACGGGLSSRRWASWSGKAARWATKKWARSPCACATPCSTSSTGGRPTSMAG